MLGRNSLRGRFKACLCVAWIGHSGISKGFLTAVNRNGSIHMHKMQTVTIGSAVSIGPSAIRNTRTPLPLRAPLVPLRSISVSSIVQQVPQPLDVVFNASMGLLAFAGKTYAFLLLVVFFLQRKLIFLPSPQVADPRAYSNLEVIQIAGPQKGTTLSAIYFKPKPSKPVVVPLGKCQLILASTMYKCFFQRWGRNTSGNDHTVLNCNCQTWFTSAPSVQVLASIKKMP